jgi:hypothetical protein
MGHLVEEQYSRIGLNGGDSFKLAAMNKRKDFLKNEWYLS